MNYYIADLHFGHKNAIRYDKRPFNSVEEMDSAMIESWNKAVRDKDTVYILGDFSWYKPEKTCEILDSLKGRKVLIRGNHDGKIIDELKARFDEILPYLELRENGKHIILSHYPILFWNGQHRGSILLYGHVHSSKEWDYCNVIYDELKKADIDARAFNVGCMIDYMGYTPRTLDWIVSKKV